MSKTIYTHKHHIVPRHAGGSNDPSNLKELTIEEHALAHKKLFFIYGRWQDELAYQRLENQITCQEAAREASRQANLGNKQSQETKDKRTASIKRFYKDNLEAQKRFSEACSRGAKGRKVTLEGSKKLSLSRKGKCTGNAETQRKKSIAMKEYWRLKKLNK